MSLSDKMRAFEMRFVSASFVAGASELLLRWITGLHMFGYLGTGMILYSLFHYVQIVKGDKRWK